MKNEDLDFLDSIKELEIITNESQELAMPKRCGSCLNAPICSFLPTFINISKFGIYLGIEECKYYRSEKKTKSE